MDIATYILLAPVLRPVLQEAMVNEVVDACAQGRWKKACVQGKLGLPERLETVSGVFSAP